MKYSWGALERRMLVNEDILTKESSRDRGYDPTMNRRNSLIIETQLGPLSCTVQVEWRDYES